MKKKKGKVKAAELSFSYFFVATIILGIIWMTATDSTFHYDPAFGGGISFIFFVLPGIAVSAVILFFVLLFKPKHTITAIIAFLVVFACGTYFFFYQETGLPGSPWEYNKELSDIFIKSAYVNKWFDVPFDYYRVYTNGGQARIFEGGFYGSYKNFHLMMEGLITDGDLFLEVGNAEYWQVYPTMCVGDTVIGDFNDTIKDVVLLVNLSGDCSPSSWAYINGTYVSGYLGIVDTDLNFLTDLDEYGFSIGDNLAIYGDHGYLPWGYSNYIIVKLESAEIVEVIPKEIVE